MKKENLHSLNQELEIIQSLPVVIPSQGLIAGYAKFLPPMGPFGLMQNDNFHYPMGVSYIKHGISGVRDLALAKMKETFDEDKRDFYEGIATVYDEVNRYFSKYIPALEEMIENTSKKEEILRLQTMKESFVRLTTGKPVTFLDSLQLVFIMSRIRCLDWHADIGRLDQHLFPFFKYSRKNNGLTDAKAVDLLVNFYDRINEVGSGDTLINIMVGGSDEFGNDVSNDLSVLILKAGCLVKGTEPHLNFRVHKKTRKDLLEAAYELQAQGRGQGTMYNDETIIPELVKYGVEKRHACQYTNDGCTEIMLDGIDTIDFNHIDAVATFVLAMYNGALPKIDKTPIPYLTNKDAKEEYNPDVEVGFKCGRVENAKTFEEFYTIFKKQWQYQTKYRLNQQYEEYLCQAENVRISYFLNGTFEDALERGLGIYQGGLPKNTRMVFSGSIPTTANCLMAIKKFVFDERKYTIGDIKKACEANYEGYEVMRQELLHAPKFGNDIDEVDLLAKRVGDDFLVVFEEHYRKTGVFIAPAFLGWRFVEEAYGIGATPDGRKYGDPIAEHYCPTPGTATNGPTATLNSICKGSLQKAVGVAATHITLPTPQKDEKEISFAMCKALSEAAFKKDIVMLNLAIYDKMALLDAQVHPENHQDLIVRVWGFSARFVDLSRQMQDHVISRIS